jgi:uncharacterized protein YndB with AHSA1/START domain
MRVCGRFKVRFRMLDRTEHESTGEYLEVEEPKHLVMSWQWTTGGEPAEAANISRLSFDLNPIDSGTELTLTDARLMTEAARISHEQGWVGTIDKLARRFSYAFAHHHLQTRSGLASPMVGICGTARQSASYMKSATA